jgi:FKBP-type peptidyl-prolyl cis-trans isomerase
VFDPCKTLSEEYRQGTAALANSDEDAILPKEAYKKLPSGLVYADVRTGTEDQAVEEGSRVNIQWVLRKSNGYFVDSSEVSGGVPFIFTVGKEGEAIAGLDEGIRGMKVLGVRRLLRITRLNGAQFQLWDSFQC